MTNKSHLSAGRAAALSIAFGIGMAFLPSSGFAAPSDAHSATAQTSGSQLGTVLLVHPQKSTAAFLSVLHLPAPHSDNGRFAVLNLSSPENKRARYALVYVPQGVEVKPHDVVALEPGVSDLMRQPGKAVVALIVSKGGQLSATVIDNEVSKVVMVAMKNGRSEL